MKGRGAWLRATYFQATPPPTCGYYPLSRPSAHHKIFEDSLETRRQGESPPLHLSPPSSPLRDQNENLLKRRRLCNSGHSVTAIKKRVSVQHLIDPLPPLNNQPHKIITP